MRGLSEFRLRRHALGASLVELVVAIVVVGVVASAAMGVLGRHSIGSTDALMTQQALAIARGLLDEVLSQGTDALDPDGGANAIGPEAGEARGSATAPFDHVDDYHGYTMNDGIVAFDGTAIPGLSAYRASVTVSAQSIGGMPSSYGYWVTVTVTAPGGVQVVLEGFRSRLT